MDETIENRAFNFFTPLRFGILLALLIFASFPQVILGLQTFVARDYGFFAYPLAHFQYDCFWRGEIPFWNPFNNCGVPFLAQWNTMPLYPPSLIYLLLPLPWSLNFFDVLHLWFAGFGMYFLARRWTQNNFATAFAGTVFSFNGMTLNLLMWPSHLATFSWMPWVVLAVESAWRGGGRKIFLAAIVGALQMLAGGPEIIFFTWLILLALWIQQFTKNEFPRKLFWRFPLIIAFVIFLSAAQLLPFLDLAAHSQRESGYADLRWSMPLRGLANFLVPMAFGRTQTEGIFFQNGQFWTSSYYLGIGTLWLALLAIFPAWRNSVEPKSKIRLLAIFAIVAVIFALGENTPVLPALRNIFPQLGFVTYPVKYLLLVTFIAPLLAAFSLARICASRNQKIWKSGTQEKSIPDFLSSKSQNDFPRLAILGVILFLALAAILFWIWKFSLPTDDVRAALLNGFSRAGFLILTGAILFFLARQSESKFFHFAPLILVLIAWLDVLTHEPPQNPTVPPNVYEENLARADLKMQPQPELGKSRAMVSPKAFMDFIQLVLRDPKNNFLAKRLGYCADANLLDSVPKVDGFFSLSTREYDDLFSLIYGATNEFPQLENFLGVSQITAPDEIYHWRARTNFLPLVTAGQKPIFLDDAETLRALAETNFEADKMVFLPPEEKLFVTVSNQTSAKILDSKFGIQKVEIEAQAAAPSLVVVAQTFYHDWRAFVDGKSVPILRANHAFQAIQIPQGEHRVQLIYKDRAFEIGAAISIAAWIVCLLAAIFLPRKNCGEN